MYRILFPSRKQDDGSNLYLNAHKIRLAPICPNTNKQTHLSFKTEVGHPDYHVLLSSIIFSLYIFLYNRADIMQRDGMSQLRHPVAFFSFVWLLPSYCIIKNLVDSGSIRIGPSCPHVVDPSTQTHLPFNNRKKAIARLLSFPHKKRPPLHMLAASEGSLEFVQRCDEKSVFSLRVSRMMEGM